MKQVYRQDRSPHFYDASRRGEYQADAVSDTDHKFSFPLQPHAET